MNERFQVVPAAYVVLIEGDRVLLQRRSGTGYMDGLWATAAAGHVEADESVVAAAIREAREETGVEIAPADLEPLTALHRTGGNHQWIDERVDWFFRCPRWSGVPAVQEPEKSAGMEWFDLSALPHDMVPHERWVISRMADGVLAPIETFGFSPEQAAEQAAASRGELLAP